MSDYKRRLSKRLKFTSAVKSRGDQIFDSIAKKLELKRKEVTFVAIHNRRGEEYRQWMKKSLKKNPFKKKYFYDAMEDMR
jgi:phage/plasmid-associated DNA primase